MGGGMVGKQPFYVNNEGGSRHEAFCELSSHSSSQIKIAKILALLTFREVGGIQGANERTLLNFHKLKATDAANTQSSGLTPPPHHTPHALSCD